MVRGAWCVVCAWCVGCGGGLWAVGSNTNRNPNTNGKRTAWGPGRAVTPSDIRSRHHTILTCYSGSMHKAKLDTVSNLDQRVHAQKTKLDTVSNLVWRNNS